MQTYDLYPLHFYLEYHFLHMKRILRNVHTNESTHKMAETIVCYNPASCIQISNCSLFEKYTCDPETEQHIDALDTYFYSNNNQFCKGVTCCELVRCVDAIPPSPMLTLPIESTPVTLSSNQPDMYVVVLLCAIPVTVLLLIVLGILICHRNRNRVSQSVE